ncbi:MAG: 6-phosphofructokinase [Atribacterota bacterium]
MGEKKVAILVGGGPAPGLNGVISAVTLESIRRGKKVVGILNGFKYISSASFDPDLHTVSLDAKRVDGIQFRGGSILGTARDSLVKGGKIDEEKMENVKNTMKMLGVNYLVTTGGDDTAFSASIVSHEIKDFYVAHVPKTIDNDLPLPGNMPTFGFQTARELGTQLLKNILEDARTTGRWYFIVAMGRTAGHLSLGMGKTAGASLTIIPEQFGEAKTSLKSVCDLIDGTIVKSKAQGRS